MLDAATHSGKPRSTWSWIIEFAGIHRTSYLLSVILALAGVACELVPYVITAEVITALLVGTHDWGWYAQRLLLMAALWLVRQLLLAASTALSHKATFHVLGTMRKRACDKLARRPLGDVLGEGAGSLKSIVVERIDSMETVLAHVIPEFTSNLAASAAILAYLFATDWRMGLAALVTLPLGMACFGAMMKDNDTYQARSIAASKDLNSVAVEYIRGIEVIKVFGKTKSSYERFSDAARVNAQAYVDWMGASIMPFTFAQVLLPASLAVVVPVGGLLMLHGALTTEKFVLCTILSIGAVSPIWTCMSYMDDLRVVDGVVAQITQILTAREQERPATTAELPHDGSVCLRGVRFGYDGTEVLHGVDLSVPAGSFCALVGPSGSGKTTIARLVSGMWDADEGSILLGGVDVRAIAPADFNTRVAYVSQSCYLFDDTIRDNIRMGNPLATDEQVDQAARAAGCYDFVMALEQGFETRVGSSGGAHLSGGERQRLSIARALLKDAPVVVFDEATAYMDPENEALVQESVSRLVQGKTLIVIAHRLSTVQDADQICVVSDGTIAERGTHDELLAADGLYRRLWDAHVAGRDSADDLEGQGVLA